MKITAAITNKDTGCLLDSCHKCLFYFVNINHGKICHTKVRPFIGPAKDQPEGSKQPGRAHVPFIRLCVQSHSTAADAYVIAPYLSLSVRSHANRSTHQSAHPRCFLISAHPPADRVCLKITVKKGHPVQLEHHQGCTREGSVSEPLSGFRQAD